MALNGGKSLVIEGGEGGSESRRQFLSRLFWGLIGFVSLGIATPVITYLIRPLFGPSGTEEWVRMGKADALPLNVPQRLETARRVRKGWVTEESQAAAWAVRRPDQLYLFDPHCTHLGCAYHWDEQAKQFICPCHNGVFDINGNVISGPPPRPLDRYVYEIREGILYAIPIPVKQVV